MSKLNPGEIRDDIRAVIEAIERAEFKPPDFEESDNPEDNKRGKYSGWEKPWILNILNDIANGTQPDTAFEFTNDKGGRPPNDQVAEFAIYLQVQSLIDRENKSVEEAAADISDEYAATRSRRIASTVSERITGLSPENVKRIYNSIKQKSG